MGYALVICVLLVIAAWQIEKRNAWRKAAKWVGYTCATLILGAVVIWGGNWAIEEWKTRSAVQELKRSGASEYFGVRLGMTSAEVRYVMGEPISKEELEDDGGSVWLYDDRKKGVVFTNEVVRVVGCDAQYSWECPDLAGVLIGDSEEDVIKDLGTPIEKPELTEDGKKILRYGPDEARVQFWLAQGKVQFIRISNAAQK